MLKSIDSPSTFSTELNALLEMSGIPSLNLTGFVPPSLIALQQYFGFAAPAPSAPTTKNLIATGADHSPLTTKNLAATGADHSPPTTKNLAATGADHSSLTTVNLAATEVHQLYSPMRVSASSPQQLTPKTQQTPALSVYVLLPTVDPEQVSLLLSLPEHTASDGEEASASPVLRTEVTEHRSPLLLRTATPATLPTNDNKVLPQRKNSRKVHLSPW